MLEALYELLIAEGRYSQEDFDRLMSARMKAWGIDPEQMTVDQIVAAMQESINRLLVNLHHAMASAANPAMKARFLEVIAAAERLRNDIGDIR
jgi:ribosomal protein L12E/L44/L45/RPP1/RPP2